MFTHRFRSAAVGLVLVALVGMTGCQAKLPGVTLSLQRTPLTTVAEAGPPMDVTLEAADQALEQIYRQANPSVVNITVKVAAPTAALRFGYAQGSGFVWDKAGHIVTNNHVVDGAREVSVTFADDRVVPAEVIGTDPDSDLAVLKVDLPAETLHPMTLGDSSEVQVGQHVVAIGNPFGLSGTMTSGIVSAVGRVLPNNPELTTPGFSIPDVIQTDAAINPGNSGGPLLDSRGAVIGVNFQIQSLSGANDGIGFAIPINTARRVVPELIKAGRAEHTWLGIEGRTVTPELAKALNLPVDQGAQVVAVVKGGPADLAGLRESSRQAIIDGRTVPTGGDIIVAAGGQPVHKMEDLITIVTRHDVGSDLDLTIRRGARTEHVTVTLAARPRQVPASDSPSK